MSKKPVETPSDPDETVADIAASIFREALSAIRTEIRGVVGGRIVPKGHEPAAHVAWLAKQAASVASELRKAEKGELDALKRLTAAQILLWVRQQPAEVRARVARDVAALDSKERKSVLG